jgi:hypothetical protein
MEPHPRTQAGPGRLRPLNPPEPVELRADRGVPVAVLRRSRWRRVAQVEEVWRVDDGWWRAVPTARTYFRLALEDGHLVTLYREDAEGRWWTQRY